MSRDDRMGGSFTIDEVQVYILITKDLNKGQARFQFFKPSRLVSSRLISSHLISFYKQQQEPQ